MKKLTLLISLFLTINYTFAQKGNGTLVLIQTNLGNIKVKLYNETPKHRDNFISLVASKYYNGILFHRVIKDFMLQTGDPNSKNAAKNVKLGTGGPGYTIPSELNPALIHKKGALAAARQSDEVNPTKASSGSQFYIVQGKPTNDATLNQIEVQINNSITGSRLREFISKSENKHFKDEVSKFQGTRNKAKLDSLGAIITKLIDEKYKNELPFKYTPAQREIYKTIGGTPFLDMNYTVFGEVIEGLDIIDKIATIKTLPGDRPEQDVMITSVVIVKK